jgi:hypothetical protein
MISKRRKKCIGKKQAVRVCFRTAPDGKGSNGMLGTIRNLKEFSSERMKSNHTISPDYAGHSTH